VRQPMAQYGVQARIGRQHFERGARRWIAVEYATHVFSQTFKHGR